MPLPDPDELIPPGTQVDVRNTFDRGWTKGFEVIDAGPEGYRLLRGSDGRTLPTLFAHEDVRRERRNGTWWH